MPYIEFRLFVKRIAIKIDGRNRNTIVILILGSKSSRNAPMGQVKVLDRVYRVIMPVSSRLN